MTTAGPGAIFVGNMAGALLVTMIVFGIVYSIRKRYAIRTTRGSILRGLGLLFCASVISGLICAAFHGVLTTGLGMIADSETRNDVGVLALVPPAWFASELVLRTIGRRGSVTGNPDT
jgi:hypothetical protein